MEPSPKSPTRPAVLDKPGRGGAQADPRDGGALVFDGSSSSGRFDAGLLVRLRWLILGAEFAGLLIAGPLFALKFPFVACMGVVVVATLINIAFGYFAQAGSGVSDTALAAQLTFGIGQIAALMVLTGGSANPFTVLLIAPASLAAATLNTRRALAVILFAALLVGAMTLWSLPLPWPDNQTLPPPPTFKLISGAAILAGMGFTCGYAWRVAVQAARMEVALNYTQTVLAREQRLSALGGLAAAAAHELGTPLATISIVAKEMARDIGAGALRDDAELLVAQAERCREILHRLTEEPDTDDAVHARMTLLQLVNEVIEPHLETPVRVEAVVAGPPGARQPEIRRMPEVLHAMTSLVENAVDFARSEVLVSVRFDEAMVSVEVRDDGPGFSPDILTRLGQPYVTSRPGAEGSRSGHVGMGLGFFIAKTLLERTGAGVTFHNGKRGGAIIAARWPREAIEAPPIPGGFELGALDQQNSATQA